MQNNEQRYLTIEEIHNEEANILKLIKDFCESNDITYYICGGTLLGAIRHKGFIPWDDDIDVLMPRKQFEKFQEIASKKKIGDNIDIISYHNGTMNYPYCKVINKNIRIADECLKDKLEPYLWVDIFPMDGLSENENDNKKLYKKVIKTRKLLLMLCAEDNYIQNFSKSKIKSIGKKVIRFFLGKRYIKRISKKLDKLSKTYDFEESEYVGGVLWGYGPQERLLKSELKDMKVDFEGMKVNTFECYDKYLTNLYGDYMTLPPVEKRITHEIKVYKVGE